jgi:23S rRNA pseudouridine2605 synthase
MAKKADQEESNSSAVKQDGKEKPARRNLRKEANESSPAPEKKRATAKASEAEPKKPVRERKTEKKFDDAPRENFKPKSLSSESDGPKRERPQRTNLKAVGSKDSDKPSRFTKDDGEEKSFRKPFEKRGDDTGRVERPRIKTDRKDSYGDKPKWNSDKRDDKPRFNSDRKEGGDKPRYNSDRKEGGDKPRFNSDRKEGGDKPRYNSDRKEGGDKPRYNSDRKEGGDKPRYNSDRKEGGDKPRYSSDRKEGGDKPRYNSDRKEGGDKPRYKSSDDKSYDKPRRTDYRDNKDDSKSNTSFDRPKRADWKDKKDDGKSSRDFDNPSVSKGPRKPGNDEWLDDKSGDFRPVESAKYERGSKRGPARDKDSGNQSEWMSEVPASWKKKPTFSKKKREPTLEEKDGKIRLNKYISNAGICSRREADELIASGAVKVNGKIVTELGTRISPETDKIQYGDETLSKELKRYLLLNKPKDYITTATDPEGRKTVMELIEKACKERLYPVGRLDRATTGLLLFTNDGEIARKLTHPSSEIKKVYHVTLSKNLKPIDMKRIMEGLDLEDGRAEVDSVDYVGEAKEKNEIGIELHSGKNRIVRRIFEHLGYEIVKLDRTFFAGLNKKDLPRGKFRFLTEKEVITLKMS